MRRQIDVDEAKLRDAMEATDATDELEFLREALRHGPIEWDGIVEGKQHHEYADWSKDEV